MLKFNQKSTTFLGSKFMRKVAPMVLCLKARADFLSVKG